MDTQTDRWKDRCVIGCQGEFLQKSRLHETQTEAQKTAPKLVRGEHTV